VERNNLHRHHVDGQQLAFAKNNGQGHEFGSYITLVDKQIIIYFVHFGNQFAKQRYS